MSRVAKILEEQRATHARKLRDYAPDPAREFENFEFSAAFAARVCLDLAADDKRRSAAVLLGVKMSRLMTLGLAGTAQNEAVRDTLLDAANYCLILAGMQDEIG